MRALPEVEAWLAALRRWTGEGPPPSLAALGVMRRGGPAPQLPSGPGAAEALVDPARLARYLDQTLLRPDATEEEVRRLAEEARAVAVGGQLGVKASGGIRSAAQARELVAAGASRLGTSMAGALLGRG